MSLRALQGIELLYIQTIKREIKVKTPSQLSQKGKNYHPHCRRPSPHHRPEARLRVGISEVPPRPDGAALKPGLKASGNTPSLISQLRGTLQQPFDANTL